MIHLIKTAEGRGSAVNRVQSYFDANPGEALSIRDAVVKFDIGHCTALEACEKLRAQGLLTSRRAGPSSTAVIFERAE